MQCWYPIAADHFTGTNLKDEVLKINSIQKQTRVGQRTRFKALVATTALKAVITLAEISMDPVRRGYEAIKISQPQTGPCKVSL